ncbi:probably inactive leucine-rich repeat receptor-like protein kinase At5g48380 [Nicotiana tomentosiformis]|uniref:probably inactive leucine-rich repeat receptor-like protein kinase At5g48380 n=1 Tax=Nicotiana tomentosiformis TaxID=4098 RepID=UPI00388C8B32
MEISNFTTKSFFLVSNILGFLLFGRIYLCSATETDIHCLKSIKDSLQDPFNSLDSWDFSNSTEGFICRFIGIECWHPDENKVLNIMLSKMGLIGEFPRGIQNCTSLTGLNISNNNLYGTIPSDISVILEHVTTLDLSNNTFSGNIPPDIANCAYLNILKLENNNLEGEIPSRIGDLVRLKTFSVANNPGICGEPLNKCEDISEDKWKDTCSFIQGKTINKIIFSVNKWKLRSKQHVTSAKLSSNHKFYFLEYFLLLLFPVIQYVFLQILKLEKFVSRMSFMELEKATSGFSEDYLVGNGMLGKVYKAILPNDWTLAIKKFNDWENLEEEFVSEITTLGGLRHQNLLPLIGFCAEKEKRLLVYKYMHNGNLHEWLHSTEDNAKILDFHLRAKIALGVAKGLAWLHHGHELHVTHGSISTRCILLDQYFEPKISNFWEAKFWSKNDTALSWSLFPVAEYSGLGSYKQDIYCFGVVLLELVTGKEPYELTSSRNLFDHSPCLLDADRHLLGKGVDDLTLQFLELACNCVKFFPNKRPTVLEVYDTLRLISQGRTDLV